MKKDYDVLIIGCGVAGLYAALNLPQDYSVLVLSKKEWTLCNSALAQGGIAGVYKPTEEDNVELHRNDTFIAGGGKNDPVAVDILVNEAAADLDRLVQLGVEFDKNPDGSFHTTLEGGHCRHRIYHHADKSGFEILTKLHDAVSKLPNVTILENTLLCELKTTRTGFSAYVSKNNAFYTVNSYFCILATGGIGRAYEVTTNSAIATGDGISFAYEMGAEIRGLNLVQFHPTAFNCGGTRECFLISEALRGEGAHLLNCNYERFMNDYDGRLELAPRDVVSRAIILESRKTGSNEFFIDISHKDPTFIVERFPAIYAELLKHGYDLTTDRIPIYPCQHYLMGGINVDSNAKTNIARLYAAGECSHTGVHGNNRLASNSLLEALVFSRRAAQDIASYGTKAIPRCFEKYEFSNNPDAAKVPHGIRTEVRRIMQQCYFVIPDKQLAKANLERVISLKRLLTTGEYYIDHDYVEAKSLVTIAYLILKEFALLD